MPGIPAARVVAVIADAASGGTQFGSGYLLDAAHVLTARHCVIDRETRRPVANLRVVRASDGAVAPVRVNAATEQDLDVALLAVTGELPWGTDLPGGPVVFGMLDREHAGQLDGCEAAGFPRWQENGIGALRDVAEVHGLIRVLEGRESQRLVLRDPVLAGVTADGGPAWAGFSGAAVFHSGLLLGVVIEHHARQGDTALQIRPVEAVRQADNAAARRLGEALGLRRDGAFRLVAARSDHWRAETAREAALAGQGVQVGSENVQINNFYASSQATESDQTTPGAVLTPPEPWRVITEAILPRLGLDNWNDHVGGFLESRPNMLLRSREKLLDLATWLNGLVFPTGQPELRRILSTLRMTLNDLIKTFDLHSEIIYQGQGTARLLTAQFYKPAGGGPHDAVKAVEYHYHINLLSDLALELTRAVNWLCDFVRSEYDPLFRLKQGALQIRGGEYEDADYRWFRPEYTADEKSSPTRPYTSLEDFRVKRFTRDIHTPEQP